MREGGKIMRKGENREGKGEGNKKGRKTKRGEEEEGEGERTKKKK